MGEIDQSVAIQNLRKDVFYWHVIPGTDFVHPQLFSAVSPHVCAGPKPGESVGIGRAC